MRSIQLKFLFGIGIVTASASVIAQGVPNAPYLSLSERGAFLVADVHVQRELGLTAGQQNNVRVAVLAHSKSQGLLFARGTPTESSVANEDKRFSDRLLKLLSATQQQRLTNIAVRRLGPSGLAEAPIAGRFGLTKDQVSKISKILDSVRNREGAYDDMLAKGIDTIPAPKSNSNLRDYNARREAVINQYVAERQRVSKVRAEADTRILATLSARQRAAWAQITKG